MVKRRICFAVLFFFFAEEALLHGTFYHRLAALARAERGVRQRIGRVRGHCAENSERRHPATTLTPPLCSALAKAP